DSVAQALVLEQEARELGHLIAQRRLLANDRVASTANDSGQKDVGHEENAGDDGPGPSPGAGDLAVEIVRQLIKLSDADHPTAAALPNRDVDLDQPGPFVALEFVLRLGQIAHLR